MRNALAHANKNGRRVVSAFIATAFAQASADAAGKLWRQVADQLRAKLPRLAALLDKAEVDVLAFMTFPREHWDKISSTNPIERPNGERPNGAIKRRTKRRRHLSQRRRHPPPRRRDPDGAGRRMGRPARSLHDPGNHGDLER